MYHQTDANVMVPCQIMPNNIGLFLSNLDMFLSNVAMFLSNIDLFLSLRSHVLIYLTDTQHQTATDTRSVTHSCH